MSTTENEIKASTCRGGADHRHDWHQPLPDGWFCRRCGARHPDSSEAGIKAVSRLKDGDEPATDEQRRFVRRIFNTEPGPGLTKQDAQDTIGAFMARSRRQPHDYELEAIAKVRREAGSG